MHHRNLLSFFRRLAGASLSAALLSLALPALAENPANSPAEETTDSSPQVSLRMSSLDMPSAEEPGLRDPQSGLTIYELNTTPHLSSGIDLTADSDNLWDRIRNGFAMPNLNDDLTLYYQQWYQARPEALRRMVERSRPFMHFIVQELEARGMPTELALLPMVESSFNSMAYSRAHAAGLWQFIPATGKRFNLEQNWWEDQRRDVVASTSAALDYLQSIYDMHGDWYLALASYNWGEGAVRRAIEKNSALGLPTDYVNLNMPNETRHYVPKLQALKNIFGNPALMVELGLPKILNRPYFATIDTVRPMDVKTAARLANMSVDEFVALNPSHNRPVIQADTPLVLPTDKLTIFRSNLEKNAGPLSRWQTYTLKHREGLKQIAPRFGISANELARVNSLPLGSRLGAGSTLLVPAGEGSKALTASDADLTQIIEVEQPRCRKRHCRSAGKSTRGTTKLSARKGGSSSGSAGKSSSKNRGKLLATGKSTTRNSSSSSRKKQRTASSKTGRSAKVARSTSGRRS